jgi:hypothetical protein
MKKNRTPLLLIAVIIIVLGVVYAISVVTRRHETNDASTPNLTETPVNRNGNLK